MSNKYSLFLPRGVYALLVERICIYPKIEEDCNGTGVISTYDNGGLVESSSSSSSGSGIIRGVAVALQDLRERLYINGTSRNAHHTAHVSDVSNILGKLA